MSVNKFILSLYLIKARTWFINFKIINNEFAKFFWFLECTFLTQHCICIDSNRRFLRLLSIYESKKNSASFCFYFERLFVTKKPQKPLLTLRWLRRVQSSNNTFQLSLTNAYFPFALSILNRYFTLHLRVQSFFIFLLFNFTR